MIELYHYTDRLGYEALISGKKPWRPSSGFSGLKVISVERRPVPGLEHLFPTDPSVFNDISEEDDTLPMSSAAALAAMLPSGTFHDINYGPGWYVSDITPDMSTIELLNILWSGNPKSLKKTSYWLKIAVDSNRVHIPDKLRPHVMFVPIIEDRRLRGDPPGLWCQSSSYVYLVSAGIRKFKTIESSAIVQELFHPDIPVELIEPFMFGVSGYTLLSPEQQANLRSYFAIKDETE